MKVSVYHASKRLEAFGRHERALAHEPLSGGPFRGFLAALHGLQAAFPVGEDSPIRNQVLSLRVRHPRMSA